MSGATIVQLNPPISLYVPELDDYMTAWFLFDYHVDEHLYWVGPLDKTLEIWMLSNPNVLACRNLSTGRTGPPKPEPGK